MTLKDLSNYMRKYSPKTNIIVKNKGSLVFETHWSLGFNEFVDTDGNTKVLEAREGYNKVKVSNYNFILHCYQENGVPVRSELYVKDTSNITLNKVSKALNKLF